jgi:hypothetical protein
MKILLNQWDNPRLSDQIFAGKGDTVFACESAKEWGFIPDKEYEIQDTKFGEYLIMKNEDGKIDEYSTEYFKK